jgi:hypothetical protein
MTIYNIRQPHVAVEKVKGFVFAAFSVFHGFKNEYLFLVYAAKIIEKYAIARHREKFFANFIKIRGKLKFQIQINGRKSIKKEFSAGHYLDNRQMPQDNQHYFIIFYHLCSGIH